MGAMNAPGSAASRQTQAISAKDRRLKVLVTGANGFLGRHVVAALRSGGHAVRALVRPGRHTARPGWGPQVEICSADLVGEAPLRPPCSGVDAVIHLAADLHGNDASQLKVAVEGTRRLIEAMDQGTTRLILASSFAVYDWSAIGAVLTEESPLLDAARSAPYDGYARAKSEQERVVRSLCRQLGIPLTVLRPAAIWGAGHLLPSDVGPRAGRWCFVIDPGRRLRLSYVENCASAFVAALDPRAAERTYNIDDGFDLNAHEFVRSIGAMARPSLRAVPVPRRAAASLGTIGAAFARVLLNGRKPPGLLIPERFQARFHAATAGHASLFATLGWSPPYQLEQCLARADAAAMPASAGA